MSKIHTFEVPADKLYKVTKAGYFELAPECYVSVCIKWSSMDFYVNKIAQLQPKTKRLDAMAIILAYGGRDTTRHVADWLAGYSSADMQRDWFDLHITEDGKIAVGKQLAKAMRKIRGSGVVETEILSFD